MRFIGLMLFCRTSWRWFRVYSSISILYVQREKLGFSGSFSLETTERLKLLIVNT